MITKFGKRFLTNYLAGNVSFGEKNVALGIGNSSESDLDSRLNFEFFRFPIEFGSIDIETNDTGSPITARDGETIIADGDTLYSVVYKTVIPQNVSGVIKEIGIYPSNGLSSNRFSSKMISVFEDPINWNLVGGTGNPDLFYSDNTYVSRVGNTLLKVLNDAMSSLTREYKSTIVATDFSGYSTKDSITLAYIKDQYLDSIIVKLYSSDTDYFYLTFSNTEGTVHEGSPWTNAGYKIHSNDLENLQIEGSPDITNINAIGLVVKVATSAPSTVYFDAIRINDEDTFDPLSGMISRSVLATPITKISGQQLDLEYRVGLNF